MQKNGNLISGISKNAIQIMQKTKTKLITVIINERQKGINLIYFTKAI